jgi:hypothetical protein
MNPQLEGHGVMDKNLEPSGCAWQDSNLRANQGLLSVEDSTEDSTGCVCLARAAPFLPSRAARP